jgi:hypothetical protein
MRRKFAGFVVGIAPAAQLEGLCPSRPPLKIDFRTVRRSFGSIAFIILLFA